MTNSNQNQIELDIKNYDLMLNSIRQAVIATDAVGTITYFNRAAEDLYGWTIEEVKGRNIVEVTPSNMSKEQAQEIMKSLVKGESWEGEFLVQRKDGHEFYAHVTDTPILNDKGELVGIIGVSNDISMRKKAEEALRESQQKLRNNYTDLKLAQKIAKVGNWTLDPDIGIPVWSDQIYEIYERDPRKGPIPLKEYEQIYKGEDWDIFINAITNASQYGKSYDIELQPLLPSGERKWIRAICEPENVPGKSVFFLRGTIQDITYEKLAGQKLEKSEKLLKKAQETGKIGHYEFELDSGKAEWSEQTFKIFGLDPDSKEPSVQEYANFLHPDDAPKVLEMVDESIKTGKAFDLVYRIRHSDGSYRNVHSKGELVKDETGNRNKMFGTFQDVTEQVMIEQELKASETSLREAMRIANMGAWALDLATGEVRMSQELFKLIGIADDDATDVAKHEKYYTAESWKRFQEAAENTIKTGEPYEIELEFSDAFARCSYAIARGEAKFDQNKKVIGLRGTLQDITDRKQIEKDLLQAVEKAEESDRLKTAFLANMSHEIRTPMNSILGFTDLLAEDDYSLEDRQNFIHIIRKNGDRLITTINDLIDISRIEAGEVNIIDSETNINELLDDIVSLLTPEAEQKGLQINVLQTMPDREANTILDKEKLYGILVNLTKNAIKFTAEGKIAIGYKYKEDFIEFFVKDTGIGIPLEKQEIIFNRFVSADISDTREFEGSGLGLSITKAYVEMLKGRIWIDSTEGLGSTFYFTVPLRTITKAENQNKYAELKSAAKLNLQEFTVLVVDDEESVRIYLEEILKNVSKSLYFAQDGKEAIATYRNNPEIDVILMDMKMPEMSGYEAVKKIREFDKEVTIIAQTAYAMQGDKDKALAAGCTDYISKPIRKKDLLEILRSV